MGDLSLPVTQGQLGNHHFPIVNINYGQYCSEIKTFRKIHYFLGGLEKTSDAKDWIKRI